VPYTLAVLLNKSQAQRKVVNEAGENIPEGTVGWLKEDSFGRSVTYSSVSWNAVVLVEDYCILLNRVISRMAYFSQ
jgi:hypothetical protein